MITNGDPEGTWQVKVMMNFKAQFDNISEGN